MSADAVMATKLRSRKGWNRLLALGLIFSVWLVLNAHTILVSSKGGVAWARMNAGERVVITLQHALVVIHRYWLALAVAVLLGFLAWTGTRASRFGRSRAPSDWPRSLA